jgi:hypothetical protein
MELKKTITTIFIVPTLMIDRDKIKENGFINGYIKDEQRDVQYDNCVYLLFRPENVDKFKLFLDDEYERTKAVIDDYDYQDGFVVVVYQLDKKYDKDFKLIKQGKYSKTSKSFQSIFPKMIKVKKNSLRKDEISLQYRIFNKTEDLREFWEEQLDVTFDDDMEVWQGWIEENEILFIDKLKEEYV